MRISTNVQWTASSLLAKVENLDPDTILVFDSKTTASMNKCWCGCGSETKSRFVPGHDAKFHGQAKRAARGQAPFRTEFVHEQARADWMKWYDRAKAEIAEKAIPEIAEIEEILIPDDETVVGQNHTLPADTTDELFDQF
jgi:hypothetical protein